MKHFIFLFLFFCGALAAISLEAAIKSLVFSTISCFIYKIFFSDIKDLYKFKFNFKFVMYIFWLFKEIFISTLYMIKLIFGRKTQLEPVVHFIATNPRLAKENTLYANSITLTPGTMTIDIYQDKLRVHAISEAHYQALISSEMHKKIIASQR